MATVTSETTQGSGPLVTAQVKKAELLLRAFIAKATPAFQNLDGNDSIVVKSARPDKFPDVAIPIRDLQKLWSKIVFNVTDKTYPSGYGGSFDYATTTSHIRYDTVTGWDRHPGGLGLIVLHELLHATSQGAAVWQNQWTSYLADCKSRNVKDDDGKNYWTSPFFSEVEEFCYHGSRELMSALGLPAYQGQKFDHGYEYGDLTQ